MEDARQYTCATYLAAAGVDVAGLLADEVRALVAATSDHIEVLTDQVFNPVVDTARRLEGRGRRIAYDPRLLPIIDVVSLAIDYGRVDDRHGMMITPDESDGVAAVLHAVGGTGVLGGTEFVKHPRFIERLGADFPVGPLAIIVNGVFGWLEPERAKTETTSAAQLISGATQLAVAASAGFRPRDVALIGDDLYVVVTSVPDALTIRFDSVGTLASAKAVGTKVRTWGPVPRPIEALAAHLAQQIRREEQARVDGEALVDPSRIRKEAVDRYMYELFPSGESAGGWVTGSLRHDMALRKYARPTAAFVI